MVWPIHVHYEQRKIVGEIKNISGGGLFIYCEEPLPLNERFHMTILPPDRRSISVTGKMIWSDRFGIGTDDTAFGMGMCFLEISDEDRRFLDDLVADTGE